MKLKILESSWSGWSRDYKPKEIEKEYDIKLNEKYVIKKIKTSHIENGEMVEEEREIFSFEIIEINESSIKIHTFQKFYSTQHDYLDGPQIYDIEINNPVRLNTPTKDYGEIYTLSLIE